MFGALTFASYCCPSLSQKYFVRSWMPQGKALLNWRRRKLAFNRFSVQAALDNLRVLVCILGETLIQVGQRER